jgi:membrane-associated phospholipid phosphatase
MKLPLFINERNKYPAGAIMFALSYTIYYLTNHFPARTPVELNMTWIDLNTPFIPLSVLIYISEYIFFAFIFIGLKRAHVINQYLYSFFGLQLISCIIFVVFPTTYPRDQFPIPTDTPAYLQAIWSWLRTQDTPNNCLPSLHVSSVYLSSFVLWDDGQKTKFWITLIWGTAIALSTLTTKQHYVADIVAGLMFALAHYWYFHRVHYYEPTESFEKGYPVT